jgi:CHAT domain-containing protein
VSRHRVRFALSLAVLTCACADSRAPVLPAEPALAHAAANPHADSLLIEGQQHYGAQDYDAAADSWERGLAAARSARDAFSEARLLMWLGIRAWKVGDFAEARVLGEESLRLKVREGMAAELSRSYNTLGLVAIADYRLADAEQLFGEAERTARITGDVEGQGRARGNLGLVATYVGDHAAAEQHFRTQLHIGAAIGNDRFRANAFANLGMLRHWSGAPAAAVAQIDSARSLYRKLGHEDGEPNALGQLAEAYAAFGDFRRAFAAVDTAIDTARRLGLRAEEEENLRLAAGLHARTGDLRGAITLYSEAESLARELGFEAQRALILRHRAEVFSALGNHRAALHDAETALALDHGAGARHDEIDDLLTLALILHAAGRGGESPMVLVRARKVANELGSASARTSIELTEARIADRDGDADRTLRALGGLLDTHDPAAFAVASEVSALAARAFARTERLDSAVVYGRRAVAYVRRARDELGGQVLRAQYAVNSAAVFSDLALVLLRMGKVSEAFDVADAARIGRASPRAGNLSDAETTPEDEKLLRSIDALLAEVNRVERTPPRERGAGAAASMDDLQRRLARLRGEYEARLIRRAQGRGSSTGTAIGELSESLAGVLAADEALIQFMTAPGRLITFVARRSGLKVIETEIAQDTFSAQIRILRDLWGTPDARWADGLPAAAALHAALLAPAAQSGLLDGARRIVVVSHGVLAQVPFAALYDDATGRFAVQDREFAYMPSAAAFLAARGERQPAQLWRGMIFAPFPTALPASVAEARHVHRTLRGSALRVGAVASEAAVRQALARPQVVHVASHGVLNATNPTFTRVELARGAGGSRDDGRLEVHEVLQLDVRSGLVFLSGCQTGSSTEWLYDLVRGAGDLTLSDAFLHAGAGAVVATLWRIDDAGAARFAAAFYRHLRSRAPAAALAAAQRELAGSSRFLNPYFWAAYTLTGGLEAQR